MRYRTVLGLLLAFGLLISAGSVSATGQEEEVAWPEQPITVVIQYDAGGGTDILTRAYTKAMEQTLGVTINAVNRPGAVGALAMDFVASKPADGYWWMGGSQFSKPLRVMGHTELNGWEDWQYFKAANGVQAWAVRPDSPFQTMEDFLEAARQNPGKYTMSNSGVGGIWHEGNEILASVTGIDVRQIPYKGGQPAVLAALQGEVDIVGSGLHEQIEHIRAGNLRNLAVFVKEPITLKDGTVLAPITDAVPGLTGYAPFGSEYTLGVKRDTPVAILEKMEEAFVAAVNSPGFEDLLEKRFFFKAIAVGEEADRLAALRECVTAWLFWDMKLEGVAKNPADLDLPRPKDFDAWWPPEGYEARLR